MDDQELENITQSIISYLKGNEKQLYAYTKINDGNFFNNTELVHMKDVYNLFYIFRTFTFVCVSIFILTLWYLNKKITKKKLQKMYSIGIILAILFVFIIVGLVALDFEYYFIMFHKILFTNDLWLLDPKTDLLINILPAAFFINISKKIFYYFLGTCIILLFFININKIKIILK